MALSEAKAIYRSKYWDVQRCDELPAGIDYAVFDYGVNSGVGRSGKVLRRVPGLDDASHVVTNAVIAAVNRREAAEVVAAICDERLTFLKRLKSWPVFGAGWGRRVSEVRSTALAMTKAGKARSTKAQIGTPGGIAAAGAAAAQQAHQSGAPPAAIIVIVLVAIVLAVVGWWWFRRKPEA